MAITLDDIDKRLARIELLLWKLAPPEGQPAPERGAYAVPSLSTILLDFPVTGGGADGPQFWALTDKQVAEWAKLFPGVDILAECRMALAWVTANQRKTAKGMPKFLVGWITRDVNRGLAAKLSRKQAPVVAQPTPVQRQQQVGREERAAARQALASAYIGSLTAAGYSALEREARYALVEEGYGNIVTPEVLRRKMLVLAEGR